MNIAETVDKYIITSYSNCPINLIFCKPWWRIGFNGSNLVRMKKNKHSFRFLMGPPSRRRTGNKPRLQWVNNIGDDDSVLRKHGCRHNGIEKGSLRGLGLSS